MQTDMYLHYGAELRFLFKVESKLCHQIYINNIQMSMTSTSRHFWSLPNSLHFDDRVAYDIFKIFKAKLEAL